MSTVKTPLKHGGFSGLSGSSLGAHASLLVLCCRRSIMHCFIHAERQLPVYHKITQTEMPSKQRKITFFVGQKKIKIYNFRILVYGKLYFVTYDLKERKICLI